MINCRERHLLALLFILGLFLVSAARPVSAIEIDTTRVRQPVPPKKPLGYKLLWVPSKLLQLPFDVLELTSRGLVHVSYESPFGQRLISNILDPNRPVFPVFASEGNAGFGGGLGTRINGVFFDRATLRASATYSVFDYSHGGIAYAVPLSNGRDLVLNLSATYDRMEREPFYGLGNLTSAEDEIVYTHERIQAGAELGYQMMPGLYLSGGIAFRAHNIFDGDDPDEVGDLDSVQTLLSLTPGDLRSSRYWSGGFGILYDYRNHPGQTTRGGAIKFTGDLFEGVGRSDQLRFYQLRLDFRQFVHLFRNRVLGVRLLAQSIDVIDDETRPRNPIYLQSYLGGEDGLQGYRPNRFADKEMALVGLEYRWPIWTIIDGVLFFEEGRVFDSFSDSFTFRDWQYSWGTGIRLWGRYGQIARMTIAFSKEETLFTFSFGTELTP